VNKIAFGDQIATAAGWTGQVPGSGSMADEVTRKRFNKASQELADELALSPVQAAELADELKTLGEAVKATERRMVAIKDTLRPYLAEHGPLSVEGLPDLILQPRSNTAWDCRGMAEGQPELFARLLELGCITVNTTLAREQARAGNIVHKLDKYAIAGQSTPAVTWETRR
jgi:hypothetical protein